MPEMHGRTDLVLTGMPTDNPITQDAPCRSWWNSVRRIRLKEECEIVVRSEYIGLSVYVREEG